MTLQVPDVRRDQRVVLYRVVLNGTHMLWLRYSELLQLHQAILKETSAYCRMRLLPSFPAKTFMGRGLSERGIERRRIALELNLERYAKHHALLTEESPAFRRFIRTFYASGCMNAGSLAMLERLEADSAHFDL